MIKPSTFSIVAFDPREAAWGVAVASKFPAVGCVVPWAKANAGAIATQAFANTSFGSLGLNMLEQNWSAETALKSLLAGDPQAASRQVGIVDANGRSVTYTGSECFEWAGGMNGDGFAIQGNILTGPEVIASMADTFIHQHGNLAWRLYQSLLAGDLAGGDRRGKQSAAILVVKSQGGYGGYNDRWIDYRVDDHPDPVSRLGELLKLHDLYFGKSPVEQRIPLEGEVLQRLQVLLQHLGYYQGEAHMQYDPPTRQALRSFIGNENFEERSDIEVGWIDAPVLEFLFQRFALP
jgi:uncharacterized Ntn-hydrolase superfamily protein